MTVTYAIETFEQIVEDIKPLTVENYDEMEFYQDIPLDPNYEFYRVANKVGMIRFYAARLGGALIGYAVYGIQPRHPQFDHKWATSSLIWLKPEHRNAGIGNGLLDFIEADLAGCVMQTATSVLHSSLDGLLLSRGHVPVGTIYSKRL